MPKYDYKCKQCGTNFFIICGINDSRDNISCTNCGSTDLARKFNVVILKGQRARGYQEESKETKPADDTTATKSNKGVKPPGNETANEPKKQEDLPAPAKPVHDHCSPEEDYL